MISLSPQELSKTIWEKQLKDFQISEGDTLRSDQLEVMKEFFDKWKHTIFTLNNHATHYAFPSGESYYPDGNYRTVKVKEGWTKQNYLCHYYWTGNATAEYTTGLLNLFPNNCRPTINSQFLGYLLSLTESPFRDAVKDLWIIRSDKPATKGFPMGILWTDVKTTNAMLLTNMLITSRLSTGWSLDLVWHRLLEMGFSKPIALVLATMFEFNGQTVTGSRSFGQHFEATNFKSLRLTNNGPHYSDQPFGRYNSDHDQGYLNFSPRKFAEGDYVKDENNTLLSGAKLARTNHIWFGDKPVLNMDGYPDDDGDGEGWDPECCDDCREMYEEAQSKKTKVTATGGDKWKLWEQITGECAVDPGIVRELETSLMNDKPTSFKRKVIT